MPKRHFLAVTSKSVTRQPKKLGHQFVDTLVPLSLSCSSDGGTTVSTNAQGCQAAVPQPGVELATSS